MSIKAGQILHLMNTFIVDRIQTGGAGNLNIPTEKIFELGNYQSVAIVRDVPDLSFSLDCLSVGTEVEQLLVTGTNNNAAAGGTAYDLSVSKAVDIVSPFKSAQGAFDVVRGVAVPQLTLESASYRYGLKENAGETFSLKGDSIFYIPGTPVTQIETGGGTSFTFDNAALLYTEQGESRYALNVSVDGVRLVPDTDYTETSAGITLTTAAGVGAVVRIVYGTAFAESYVQTVHEGTAVKPAAIRGKDIQVYLNVVNQSTGAVISRARWTDVQSTTVDFALTLEDDFEFGNPRAVAREATDAPAVTGSIEVKPLTPAALFDKLTTITGVDAGDIIGPSSSVKVGLEIVLLNPDSGGTTAVTGGTPLKTLWVPDARFTIPGYEGRVQQKLTQTLNFESDGGVLKVYKGAKA